MRILPGKEYVVKKEASRFDGRSIVRFLSAALVYIHTYLPVPVVDAKHQHFQSKYSYSTATKSFQRKCYAHYLYTRLGSVVALHTSSIESPYILYTLSASLSFCWCTYASSTDGVSRIRVSGTCTDERSGP